MKYLAFFIRAAVLLAAAYTLHAGPSHAQSARQWAEVRRRMVEHEVIGLGIRDERVRSAMMSTPRHEFVPAAQRKYAYHDMALPIGEGQTISPPFVVAYMTEKLEPQPSDKILEIGTGSGYQAAVLSPLVHEVYSIEIVESLGRTAAATLQRLGYTNVTTKVGDGYLGWPEHAPFDKIIVTCSPESIPQPLIEQLAESGRMVIPLGERYQQTLYRYRKVDGKLEAEPLQGTFFVPMTGQAEDRRELRSDDGRPDLRNGSFEEMTDDEQPAGWYYVRQAVVESGAGAPDGEKYLTCTNQVPGQWSQVVQAIGIDGRRVKEIQISLSTRLRNVRPGQSADQRPRVVLNFFDENRAPAGRQELGPWLGNSDWSTKQARFKVPSRARLAVLAVGLFGATGELSLDNLLLEPAGTVLPESDSD